MKRLSPCCGVTVTNAPAGSDGLICSKEGCGKSVDIEQHIVDPNETIPVPCFIEPVIPEPDSPKLNDYEPGLDQELFPELHPPKTGQSEPMATIPAGLNIPQKYLDPKNRVLL